MSFIHVTDFHKSTRERGHDWHAGRGQGSMRHVIAQLQGRRVFLETDKQTSHGCEVEVLDRAYSSMGMPAILVRHHHADGGHHDTAYKLMSIGSIAVLDPEASFAKWEALRSIREEEDAARRIVAARHPEAQWGSWTMTPMFDEGRVSVAYEPAKNPVDGKNRGERFHEVVDVTREEVPA